MKICIKCNESKPLTEFYKSGNRYRTECKTCNKLKLKNWRSCNKDKVHDQYLRYYSKYQDKVQERNQNWQLRNSEQYREYHRQYYLLNRERILIQQKEYQRTHKIERKAYWESYLPRRRELFIEKYYNDHQFRLHFCFSNRMRNSLYNGKHGKPWETLVGYSLSDLMNRLESLFDEGMSWENYGEWHIDHIIPVSYFKYDSYDSDAFKTCWSLDNLQPLWAEDNLKKHAKLPSDILSDSDINELLEIM